MGWFDNGSWTGPDIFGAGEYNRSRQADEQQAQQSGQRQSEFAKKYADAKSEREADIQKGLGRGREIFYNDPDMQAMRARREDLAKGYSGQELGALRQTARGELQGQRSQYLRQLAGRAAQGGIGGARRAAMVGAADVGQQRAIGDAERKMALDSGNMVRQGTSDLENFLMRQKFGSLAQGMGEAQLGVTDRSAIAGSEATQRAAEIAGREPKKGLLGQIFGGLL